MSQQHLTLDAVQDLATKALVGAGATQINANSVAISTRLAERDGIRSHGLMYVPIYAEHVQCGKVIGDAVPIVTQPKPTSIIVDAMHGFAHPAIDAGWDTFTDSAVDQGVAVMTVHHSYNCGVLGHHAKRIAEQGLIGLCFTHAPASIAPTGASKPVIGTNPVAIAIPDGNGDVAIALDQSASVVAKSEIVLRSKEGRDIESHWAMDAHGQPTTNADDALKGSMAPVGGYKGFGMGLIAELLASCLAGAVLSKDASPFAGTKGGPPATGQCFIAMDPAAFSGDVFFSQVDNLVNAITEQEGAHLPGMKAKRHSLITQEKGVMVDSALIEKIEAFI